MPLRDAGCTSVWIDHLRQGGAELMVAFEVGEVWIYFFVVRELACGNLRSRAEVQSLLLQGLPSKSQGSSFFLTGMN